MRGCLISTVVLHGSDRGVNRLPAFPPGGEFAYHIMIERGWKQNSNGKPNNWATNLSPSNPRLRNEPVQRIAVPWKRKGGRAVLAVQGSAPTAQNAPLTHKIAVIFYTMVKNQVEYDETIWETRDTQREKRAVAMVAAWGPSLAFIRRRYWPSGVRL
jgi:hypothetical protein